jgi:hypothetical protein
MNTMSQLEDLTSHSYWPAVISIIVTRIISIFSHAASFSLSLLGLYGRVLHMRWLLPCYVIPYLSALFNETRQVLECAEANGAIPPENVYRTELDGYADLFLGTSVGSPSAHTPTQFR